MPIENNSDDNIVPPLEDIPYLNKPRVSPCNYLEVGHVPQIAQPSEFNRTIPMKCREKSSATTGFGGFKKGFLSGISTDPRPKTKKDNVLTLNSVAATCKNPLVIEDVQNAMKSLNPLQNTSEWLTEDLLQRVTENPYIYKRLQDQNFMQALLQFQANPRATWRMFKNNEQMQKFLKEFSAIMGRHFCELGQQLDDVPAEREQLLKPLSSKELK